MKEKTCNQIKNVAKAFYWIFIAVGAICFIVGITLSVLKFIDNDMYNGYLLLGFSLLGLTISYLLAKFLSIVFNGYALLIENSNINSELLETEKKIYNELLKLNEKSITVPNAVQESKEDISSIKKSSKIKPRETKNKLDDLENNTPVKSKVVSSEDIKDRLAKAKGVVQKTMAVKSQVAANTISTSMLDDISDKNNIEQFETPEGYSQIEPELFKDCKNLEEVVITENIKLIGSNAFCGCDALTTITIGKGVGVIERGAFEGCTGLDKIIYKGSKKQWEEVVIQSGNEILKRVDIVFEEK